MKILIIEDELRSAAYLKKGLSEHGFTIDLANNGDDGLHSALTSVGSTSRCPV
jgi:two-component system, OmpR family, copper resistance phosphate regulon response regulator CusR